MQPIGAALEVPLNDWDVESISKVEHLRIIFNIQIDHLYSIWEFYPFIFTLLSRCDNNTA